MKRILLGILDQYADWEAAYISTAIHMLGKRRFEVRTVSLSKEPIQSIGGLCTIPDYSVSTAPDGAEALLLIGGLSWRGDDAKRMIPLVERYRRSGYVAMLEG